MSAAANRIGALAADVARLRRHLRAGGWSGGDYIDFLFGRLALHVASLDTMTRPTAAEWVRAGLSVEDALAVVDEDDRRLRSALGEEGT